MNIYNRTIEFELEAGDEISDLGDNGFFVREEGAIWQSTHPLDTGVRRTYVAGLRGSITDRMYQDFKWEPFKPEY